jgi:hypothetical protein
LEVLPALGPAFKGGGGGGLWGEKILLIINRQHTTGTVYVCMHV